MVLKQLHNLFQNSVPVIWKRVFSKPGSKFRGSCIRGWDFATTLHCDAFGLVRLTLRERKLNFGKDQKEMAIEKNSGGPKSWV